MPKRRMLNTVRTDHLERKIAHYHSMRWYEAENALRILAVYIGAPIDEDKIYEDAQCRRTFYEEPAEEGE